MTGTGSLDIDMTVLSPTITTNPPSDSPAPNAAVTNVFWAEMTLTAASASMFDVEDIVEPNLEATAAQFWS